jgi:hypothetical protein
MKIIEIRKIDKIAKNGNIYQREICTIECPICKKIYERSYRNLSKTSKCKRCSTLINNKNKIGNGHKTIGDLSGSFVNTIKQKANQRNIEFNITVEYLWELFLLQNKKCKLSNIDLKLYTYNIWTSTGKSRHHNTSIMNASLDRIDSNLGYIEGNVQWVHKVVNIMKNTLTNDEFIYFCEQIYKNNKKDNPEPSFIKGDCNKIIMKKVQRLTSELP